MKVLSHFKIFPNKKYPLVVWKYVTALFFFSSLWVSCKERDDWPEFNVTANTTPDTSDPGEDTDKTWYIEALEANHNPVYSSFIADTLTEISKGLTYTKLRFIDNLSQNIQLHIVELDLTNPDYKIISMLPYGVHFPDFQTVANMAASNEGISGGKILVAVNGSPGSTSTTNTYGIPSYPTVAFGTVMSTSNTVDTIMRAYLGVDINNNTFIGNTPDTTALPVEYVPQSRLVHQVSGAYWTHYNSYSYTAGQTGIVGRSFVGINESGKKLYFIVADGLNAAVSAGISLASMTTLMRDWGINKGFQTYFYEYSQLVMRKEADNTTSPSFYYVNTPRNSSMAEAVGTVCNALAIVYTGP